MQAPFRWLCFSNPGGWQSKCSQLEPWRPWAEQLQGSSDSEQAKAVAQWVRRVVVRHGLCPWAEEALRRGSLAVVTLDEESEEEVAAAVLAHAQLLAGLGTSPTAATTLLVAPKCGSLQDFEVYLHLCAWLEEAFEELELNGKVQLATFHPDFRFADSAGPNDAADFVGRAPAPAFHLLREKEVSAALASFPLRRECHEGNPQLMMFGALIHVL